VTLPSWRSTVAIGLVLLLVAVGRAWSEFDPDNVFRLVYAGGLVVTLVAIGALAVGMRRRIG
jgi:uncharacterized membrane protein